MGSQMYASHTFNPDPERSTPWSDLEVEHTEQT